MTFDMTKIDPERAAVLVLPDGSKIVGLLKDGQTWNSLQSVGASSHQAHAGGSRTERFVVPPGPTESPTS